MPAPSALYVETAAIDDLWLDPKNPRLGVDKVALGLSQDELLIEMRDWELDELALSILETGFWGYEPLLVVREPLEGESRRVVVEGNRRLATLKMLEKYVEGDAEARSWGRLVKDREVNPQIFKKVPYVEVASRDDVQAYLGFRHVSGIKEWRPAEKAAFIANMVESRHLSYDDVAQLIGSRKSSIRQTFIAYNILRQMQSEDILKVEDIGRRFSVLDLSLREVGVRDFLGIDFNIDPEDARTPVPPEKVENLEPFARIVFGVNGEDPLLPDSRQIKKLGTILCDERARDYLIKTDNPSWDIAVDLASADIDDVKKRLTTARDSIILALTRAHFYRKDEEVVRLIEEIVLQSIALAASFPAVVKRLKEEAGSL